MLADTWGVGRYVMGLGEADGVYALTSSATAARYQCLAVQQLLLKGLMYEDSQVLTLQVRHGVWGGGGGRASHVGKGGLSC